MIESVAPTAPDGFEPSVTVIEAVSVAELWKYFTIKEAAVVVSDFPSVAVPFAAVTDTAPITADCDGTELSTPNPNEATATSAMRLNVVFVDIYFLSIVDTEDFSITALR